MFQELGPRVCSPEASHTNQVLAGLNFIVDFKIRESNISKLTPKLLKIPIMADAKIQYVNAHAFMHSLLIHLRELLAKPRNDLTCVPPTLSLPKALLFTRPHPPLLRLLMPSAKLTRLLESTKSQLLSNTNLPAVLSPSSRRLFETRTRS